MQLSHVFTVPVDRDRAWASLLDLERTAACLPGATVDSINGNEVTGSVKVNVGPISMTYKGVAQFTQRDAERRVLSLEARSRDVRGAGTANATIVATLVPADAGTTRVAVNTDLDLPGRPAQFGTGVITEVGNRILGQFADQLAESFATEPQIPTPDGKTKPSAATAPVSAPAESLSMLPILAPLVLKRVAPVAAGFVVGALVTLVAKRSGRRNPAEAWPYQGLQLPGHPGPNSWWTPALSE
jgi:uncharacterized protein